MFAIFGSILAIKKDKENREQGINDYGESFKSSYKVGCCLSG